MKELGVSAAIVLVLSVATSVAFSNRDLPLSAPAVSVVVGFWLLVVFGLRALWRVIRRRTG
jgi:TRAP-type C4-dicarboxylate transport system permease small subunit